MIELTIIILMVLFVIIATRPKKKTDKVEYVEFINGKLYVVDKE